MCSFSLSLVTTEEVMKLLESLPDGEAAGYDLMDNRLLRYAAYQIAAPLRYLYNWSIETGHFPRVWKEAKLCPIPKNSKERKDFGGRRRPKRERSRHGKGPNKGGTPQHRPT